MILLIGKYFVFYDSKNPVYESRVFWLCMMLVSERGMKKGSVRVGAEPFGGLIDF